MARSRTIDDAVEELFKDYKKALKAAAEEATEKAKEDLYINAVSCLVQYYADYDPTSYRRTYSLIDSFVPYSNGVIEGEDEFICVAGVEFNADIITSTYTGSEKYTPTDSDWILDNFFKGVHPRTNGSMIPGQGDYDNEKYQGEFVPGAVMDEYLAGYAQTFDKNLRHSLSKQVLRLAAK